MNRNASHTAYSSKIKATSLVASAKIATILVSMIRMKAIVFLPVSPSTLDTMDMLKIPQNILGSFTSRQHGAAASNNTLAPSDHRMI